jgi:hypothetical protein
MAYGRRVVLVKVFSNHIRDAVEDEIGVEYVGDDIAPVGTTFIIMLRAIASTPVWIMPGKIMI